MAMAAAVKMTEIYMVLEQVRSVLLIFNLTLRLATGAICNKCSIDDSCGRVLA